MAVLQTPKPGLFEHFGLERLLQSSSCKLSVFPSGAFQTSGSFQALGESENLAMGAASGTRAGCQLCYRAVLPCGVPKRSGPSSFPSVILSPSPALWRPWTQVLSGLGGSGTQGHTCTSKAEGGCLQVHIEGQRGGVEEAVRHPQLGDSTCQVYRVAWGKLQLIFPGFPAPYGPRFRLTTGCWFLAAHCFALSSWGASQSSLPLPFSSYLGPLSL